MLILVRGRGVESAYTHFVGCMCVGWAQESLEFLCIMSYQNHNI